MTTVTINSVLQEKLLVVANNSVGYARYKIPMPNIATPAPGNSVSSVTMTNNGSGYNIPPNVTFTGGGGSNAAGTAVLGFAITAVTITAAGSYATLPTLSATVGSGVTLVPHMKGVGVTIGNVGTGYQVGDIVGPSTGTSTTQLAITVTSINGGGGITGFTISTPGDYTVLASNGTATTTTGDGTGATFSTILWGLLSATVSAGGANYDNTSVLTISGGGGTGGGTGTLTLASTGSVKAVNITNGGINYATAPSVNFTGGGGSSAAGTANISTVNDPVTIAVVFTQPLPTDEYSIKLLPSQPGSVSYSNKTVNGFSITLTPLFGSSLSTGTVDCVVEYAY